MSFFFGGKKADPEPSRETHVTELVASFPSIKRPNNDDSSFEIAFESNQKWNTLRVWLPSDFPVNKPVLQVVGPATHPWLDQYKRVSRCDKLTYWDKKKSSLREIVEETLSELHKPPVAATRPSCSTDRHSFSGTSSQQQFSAEFNRQSHSHSISGSLSQSKTHTNIDQGYVMLDSHGGAGQGGQGRGRGGITNTSNVTINERPISERFQIALPKQPSEFPELQTLEKFQLEKLLKDDVAMKYHASQLECVETLRSMRDELCKSNADEAQRNIKLKDDNRAEEEEVLILQSTLRAAATSYRMKLAQYRGQYAQDKQTILTNLKSDMTSLDNFTEDLAQNFVRGDQDVDSFIQEYVNVRSKYHSMKLSLKKVA